MKKIGKLIAELSNAPSGDTKSYQSGGTNLGDSPTTSPTKPTTSTPAKVPSKILYYHLLFTIFSPINSKIIEIVATYNLDSPIKEKQRVLIRKQFI